MFGVFSTYSIKVKSRCVSCLEPLPFDAEYHREHGNYCESCDRMFSNRISTRKDLKIERGELQAFIEERLKENLHKYGASVDFFITYRIRD